MIIKRERLIKSSYLVIEIKRTRLVNLRWGLKKIKGLIDREIWLGNFYG